MRTPLTMARTMPTILRLEFDWVLLLLERVDNVEDIGARLRVVVWPRRLRMLEIRRVSSLSSVI